MNRTVYILIGWLILLSLGVAYSVEKTSEPVVLPTEQADMIVSDALIKAEAIIEDETILTTLNLARFVCDIREAFYYERTSLFPLLQEAYANGLYDLEVALENPFLQMEGDYYEMCEEYKKLNN